MQKCVQFIKVTENKETKNYEGIWIVTDFQLTASVLRKILNVGSRRAERQVCVGETNKTE